MGIASPLVKLDSGQLMPLVGFGCWKVDNATCADTIYNAIKAGYRLFDGACDYGNEAECGDGIARAIQEGLVRRSDLFIVSKLWTTYHEPHRVEQACRKSMADWKVDYLDLYLVHFPFCTKFIPFDVKYPPEWQDGNDVVAMGTTPMRDTWGAMEGLVDAGIARNIGVANFQSQMLLDLLNYSRIKPATLQVEHHPYLSQPLLLDLAKKNNVQVTAYSSLGPASFIELAIKHAQDAQPLLEDAKIVAIGEKHGKTPAQVLLRWSTQRGIAVIPKSANPIRMQQNLECTFFDLDKDDLAYLNGLNRGLRFNDTIYVRALVISQSISCSAW
ncbi:hypothetical protein EsH8_VII_000005 [Colletotrichum jinshuiense]